MKIFFKVFISFEKFRAKAKILNLKISQVQYTTEYQPSKYLKYKYKNIMSASATQGGHNYILFLKKNYMKC